MSKSLCFTGRTGLQDKLVRLFGIRLWLVCDYRDEFMAQFPSTPQGEQELIKFIDAHEQESGSDPSHVGDWCLVCAWNEADAKAHYFRAFEQYQAMP